MESRVPALYLDLFSCKNIAKSNYSIKVYGFATREDSTNYITTITITYITYTDIHNYYITVQNKSGYRAGTRPSVFCEGRVTPDYKETAYNQSPGTTINTSHYIIVVIV